jgi:hypothetical protein
MQFTQPNETNMPVKAPATAKYAFVPPSGRSGNSSSFDTCSGTASLEVISGPFSRLEESTAVVGASDWVDMIRRMLDQLRIVFGIVRRSEGKEASA